MLTIGCSTYRQRVSDAGVETGVSSARLVGLVFNFDSLSASEPGRSLRRFRPERVRPLRCPAGNIPAPHRRIAKRQQKHAGYGLTGLVSDSFLEKPTAASWAQCRRTGEKADYTAGFSGNTHKEVLPRRAEPARRLATAPRIWLRDLNGKVYQRVAAKLVLRVRDDNSLQAKLPFNKGAFAFFPTRNRSDNPLSQKAGES